MNFQTEVKQVLGTPDQGDWSQVHHFTPQQKEKFLKRGELVLLVSLGEIDEDQPTASVGREIISRFHEEYYGNLDEKPMAALEEAAKKVAKEKSKYFKQPEEISLIGLVLWKNIAYLVIYHQGRILFRRKGKTVKLLDSEETSPASASGYVQTGDIFVLGTTDFFEKLPQTMIPSGLSTEDPERMVEIWAPVVHARENQGRLGAVVVKIGPEKKELKFTQPKIKSKPDKKSKKFKLKKLEINLKFLKKFFQKVSALSVAIGFLILLGVSIFFGWRKRRQDQREEKIRQLSTQIEEKINSANSIRNLDPEESLRLISQASDIAEELQVFDQSQAKSYLQRMEETKENLGEETFPPQMHYDLHLIDEEFKTEAVYTDGNQALVYDYQGQRLAKINLVEKSFQIIAGGEDIPQQSLVVFSENSDYLIGPKAVYWVKDKKIAELLELDDEAQPLAADSWFGSIYLLDPAQEEIWKFPAISEGLGSGRAWLKTKSGLDFANLVDMGIDGNIWLLAESGQFYKYLSGEKEEINLDLPSGIGKAGYLGVAQEAERIGFWDGENNIIWLFSKSGSFVARQPVDINNLQDIAISPDGSKVYLFGIDKIYLVEFTE